MLWKFKGNVPKDEIGDPLNGSTQYALCVYDEKKSVPALASRAAVGPDGQCAPGDRPCWRQRRNKVVFKDLGAQQDGVELIVLKSNRIVFKVTNTRGRLPRPVDFARMFNQDTRVTAQVVNSEDSCWEAVYEPGDVIRNLPHVYRAKTR